MPEPCARDKLLIVDDEAAIVRLFKIILSSSLPGTVVDTAQNGKEAVEAFERNRHATLLMDLHMPVMDGRQAFQKIKEICKENDWVMPSVIFCTGYAPPEWVNAAMAANPAHRMLNKPVSSSTLIETVRGRM